MPTYRFPSNLVLLFWVTFVGTIVCGIEKTTFAQIESISIGWEGRCKLGYWVPAVIGFKGEVPANSVLEITLPDTDGVKTRFAKKPTVVKSDGRQYLLAMVKLGRTKGQVEVQLRSGDQVQHQSSSRVEKVCTPIDSLLEFYVSIGKSIEISSGATIGSNSAYGKPVAANLEKISTMAGDWKAYESLDGMIIEASSFIDNPLSDRVQSAILKWVEQGGRLAITGGANLQDFFEKNPILANVFSGKVIGSRRLPSTRSIELLLKANEQLSGSQRMATLSDFAGEAMIKEGDNVVVVREHYGFGRFVLVAINLADEPMASWSSRKRLTGHVLSLLNYKPTTRFKEENRTSRFGYQDISGQLRTALDHFSSVKMVNFTVVAAIAILFICLIGPVDYFFLKKFVKKMEWTWLTFLLAVLLISTLTFTIHQYAKSNRLLVRQVEVVDIDAEKNTVRGSLWAHVYSPKSEKYDFRWEASDTIQSDQSYGSWSGFPGTALGGMNNNSTTASPTASYTVDADSGELKSVPVNVAATKGIQMEWEGRPVKPINDSLQLKSNSLTGRISNPLNVELENVFVVHRRSVFLFGSKLSPGASFDVAEDTRERSLADYLNQRKVKELGTEVTAWSNSETNLKRILEVMMFYEKAGGRGYVNLFQRYQSQIDFSHSLGPHRAVLVGRTRQPANRLNVNGKLLDDAYEESWTYYRMIVPVKGKPLSN